MDPVTTTIVMALATGAVTGAATSATDIVGREAISDAYNVLKSTIKKKYGEKSDLVEAIINIEKKPDSSARKEVLQEEVNLVKADQDSEILKAAQALYTLLEKQSTTTAGRDVTEQKIKGKDNIQISRVRGNINISKGLKIFLPLLLIICAVSLYFVIQFNTIFQAPQPDVKEGADERGGAMVGDNPTSEPPTPTSSPTSIPKSSFFPLEGDWKFVKFEGGEPPHHPVGRLVVHDIRFYPDGNFELDIDLIIPPRSSLPEVTFDAGGSGKYTIVDASTVKFEGEEGVTYINYYISGNELRLNDPTEDTTMVFQKIP